MDVGFAAKVSLRLEPVLQLTGYGKQQKDLKIVFDSRNVERTFDFTKRLCSEPHRPRGSHEGSGREAAFREEK